MEWFDRLVQFTVSHLEGAIGMDWSSIYFEDFTLPIVLGVALAAAAIAKYLYSRKKSYRAQSGHPAMYEFKEGWGRKLLRFTPKIVLAAGIFLALVALAKPFSVEINSESEVNLRERIDLIDGSHSMSNNSMGIRTPFGRYYTSSSDKASRAEIARAAHLDFLEKRLDQNDRSSLWIFSSNPYKIADFNTDMRSYMFQVYSAPLSIADIPGEGGTELDDALQAIVDYIDNNGDPDVEERALIIITDADITTNPRHEISELSDLNTTPYVMLVGESRSNVNRNGRAFLRTVEYYGGEIYFVVDEESTQEAFDDINKLEEAKVEVSEYRNRIPLYQGPLFASFIFIVTSIILSVMIEPILGRVI